MTFQHQKKLNQQITDQSSSRPTIPTFVDKRATNSIQLKQKKMIQQASRPAPQLLVQAKMPEGEGVAQAMKIGKQQIKTVAELAPIMGISKEDIVSKFNAELGGFPKINEAKLNTYFNSVTYSVPVSVTETDKFIARIVKRYIDNYMKTTDSAFTGNLEGIENNPAYITIMDKEGINYGEGEEDGASVKDTYDKGLACTLFAILKVKPGFLGATTPEELHYILRSNPKTKNYDLDPSVAQIRISAGLRYRAPASDEDTVSKLTSKPENRGTTFIIDPKGEAHTFSLAYLGSTWKQFDNDHTGGKTPGNDQIRVIWQA